MAKIERMRLRSIVITGALLFLASLCWCQDFGAALAKADTTRFSSDKRSGWLLYNSYVSQESKDSVTWEVIIQHEKKNIDWKADQYIGRIKTLLPAKDKQITYFLLKDSYIITIAANGKCYIRLVDGSLPPNDPVIIPVRIKYPNK